MPSVTVSSLAWRSMDRPLVSQVIMSRSQLLLCCDNDETPPPMTYVIALLYLMNEVLQFVAVPFIKRRHIPAYRRIT